MLDYSCFVFESTVKVPHLFCVVSRLAQDMAADKEKELSAMAQEDVEVVNASNDIDSKDYPCFSFVKYSLG